MPKSVVMPKVPAASRALRKTSGWTRATASGGAKIAAASACATPVRRQRERRLSLSLGRARPAPDSLGRVATCGACFFFPRSVRARTHSSAGLLLRLDIYIYMHTCIRGCAPSARVCRILSRARARVYFPRTYSIRSRCRRPVSLERIQKRDRGLSERESPKGARPNGLLGTRRRLAGALRRCACTRQYRMVSSFHSLSDSATIDQCSGKPRVPRRRRVVRALHRSSKFSRDSSRPTELSQNSLRNVSNGRWTRRLRRFVEREHVRQIGPQSVEEAFFHTQNASLWHELSLSLSLSPLALALSLFSRSARDGGAGRWVCVSRAEERGDDGELAEDADRLPAARQGGARFAFRSRLAPRFRVFQSPIWVTMERSNASLSRST